MFNFFKRKKAKVMEKQDTQSNKTAEEEVIVEVESSNITSEKKERKLSYHITKHPNGGWQLKKGKAQRAMKRFNTQKEAIDYAKQLEKERGISYLIHKQDGSNRKKKY